MACSGANLTLVRDEDEVSETFMARKLDRPVGGNLLHSIFSCSMDDACANRQEEPFRLEDCLILT